jgi:hypothetical protein
MGKKGGKRAARRQDDWMMGEGFRMECEGGGGKRGGEKKWRVTNEKQ